MNSEQKAIAKLGALLTGILVLSWAGSFGFGWLADHVWDGFTWFAYLWTFGFLMFIVWMAWYLMRSQSDGFDLWPVTIIPMVVGLIVFVAFMVVAETFDVGFVVGFTALAMILLNTVFVVGYLERKWKL